MKDKSRREFLKNSLIAGGGLSVIPSNLIFGAVKPSDKVNLAGIGIGHRGGDILKALHATGLVNIVALCDADMGGEHTQGVLKMFPDVPRFHDFRKMIP